MAEIVSLAQAIRLAVGDGAAVAMEGLDDDGGRRPRARRRHDLLRRYRAPEHYEHPVVRLPGAGGAPEIAASCQEVIVIVRQSRRAFVEQVDFVTSVGYGSGPGDRERLGLRGRGPRQLITDLGVLMPDPLTCEFTMTGIFAGVREQTIRQRTGWDLAIAPSPRVVPAPTAAELAALRGFAGYGSGQGTVRAG